MKRKLIYGLVLFSMLLSLIARAEPPPVEVALIDSEGARDVVLTRDDFATENVSQNALQITLTPCGTRVFREVTKRTVGQRLAIVVGGKVLASPVLRAPILDGHVHISFDKPGDADVMLKALRGK